MNNDMKSIWVGVVNGACKHILAGRATLEDFEGVFNMAIQMIGEEEVMKLVSVKKVQKMHK
jgi:hypothetical protein